MLGTPSSEGPHHERLVEALALHDVPQGCGHPLLRDLPLLRLHRRHPRDADEGATGCPRQQPTQCCCLQPSGHDARPPDDSLVPLPPRDRFCELLRPASDRREGPRLPTPQRPELLDVPLWRPTCGAGILPAWWERERGLDDLRPPGRPSLQPGTRGDRRLPRPHATDNLSDPRKRELHRDDTLYARARHDYEEDADLQLVHLLHDDTGALRFPYATRRADHALGRPASGDSLFRFYIRGCHTLGQPLLVLWPS